MTLAIWFWLIYVIAFLFGAYRNRGDLRGWAADGLVLWVLLGLLGWEVFGAAVT